MCARWRVSWQAPTARLRYLSTLDGGVPITKAIVTGMAGTLRGPVSLSPQKSGDGRVERGPQGHATDLIRARPPRRCGIVFGWIRDLQTKEAASLYPGTAMPPGTPREYPRGTRT